MPAISRATAAAIRKIAVLSPDKDRSPRGRG